MITSRKGVPYVGMTTNTVGERMREHRSSINEGHGDGAKFIEYYRQPGNDFDEATVKVIDRGSDRQDLLQKERKWIERYDSIENGLNSEL